MTSPSIEITSKPPVTGSFIGLLAFLIGIVFLHGLETPARGGWSDFFIKGGVSFVLLYMAYHLLFNRRRIEISKLSLEVIYLSRSKKDSFLFDDLKSWKTYAPKNRSALPPTVLTLYFNEKKLTFTSLQMNEIYQWIEWMELHFSEKKDL